MGIFSRLTDIINSNINTMLDRAEEPEKMLRLMIQEMENTLVEARSTAARTIAERKDLNRKVERLVSASGEWEEKAELALSKGREDLAKAALVERTKLAEAAGALKGELGDLDAAMGKHDTDIAKLESKLTEAKAKQKTLLTRRDAVDSRLKVRRSLHDRRIEEAFARFDSFERRIDRAESEAEAFDLGRRKSLAEEIAELEAEGDIERELALLKARMAARTAGRDT